jgi:hypothetical protein
MQGSLLGQKSNLEGFLLVAFYPLPFATPMHFLLSPIHLMIISNTEK